MANNSKSIVDCITATLRDEILRGQYRPGERLPSERDLASRFEASRGAIREVLKKLEELGIASINPGGVRVVPIEEASLSILGPLLELHEWPDVTLVRHLLEVMGSLMSRSARTAIERASDDEISQIQRIVQRMIATDDPKENQENWKDLARLFARINDNLVLRLIFNGLKTQFPKREDDPNFELVVDQQQRIKNLKLFELSLRKRDSKGAADAISSDFLLAIDAVERTLNSHPFETGTASQETR